MVVTCPLCGYRFDPEGENVCKGCPVNSNCEKICCPNCRYGWPASSSIIDTVLGLFRKRKRVGKSQRS